MGGHDNPTYAELTEADMAALLADPDAIQERIDALWADPAVKDIYERILGAIVGDHYPAEGFANALSDPDTGIGSPPYIELMAELDELHLTEEGADMVARDVGNLAVLDPDAASVAKDKVIVEAAAFELRRLLEDPSLVDEATYVQATLDYWHVICQAVKNGTNMATTFPLQSMISATKIDPQTLTKLSSMMFEATTWLRTVGAKQVPPVNVTPESIVLDRLNTGNYAAISAADRQPLLAGALKLQAAGVWGTLSTAAAATSFGYKIFSGAWTEESTPMERWMATRELITVLSYSNQWLTFIAPGLDKVIPRGDPNLTWKNAFGLDRTTLGQLWDTTPIQNTTSDSWKRMMGNFFQDYDLDANYNYAQLGVAAPAPGAPPPTPHEWRLVRTAQTMQKFMAMGLHFIGGVADMVISAMNMSKAVENGDGFGIVSNMFSFGAGTALTGAGAILGTQMFTAVSPWWAMAVWPLATAAAALAVASALTSIIGFAVQREKLHNVLQAESEKTQDWFKELEQYGLTSENSAEMLEYITYAYAIYGNDNPDPSQSYFEYQSAEFAHFLATPQEDGSSLNRFDPELHVHHDHLTYDEYENAFESLEYADQGLS